MTERYMRAYYYEFTPTGVDEIDAILEAIAVAGKSYHNTSQWGEPSDFANDESPCHWECIENAAHEAAKRLSSTGEKGNDD